MGQRASMQQSEVARRPRPDLGDGSTTRSSSTLHNRRSNGTRFSSGSGHHRDRDTSSASSVSSGSLSSGDDGGGGGNDSNREGVELARRLLMGMGLIEGDQGTSPISRGILRQQSSNGGLAPSSLPSSSTQQRTRRILGQQDQDLASSSRNHRRFGGSGRLNREENRRGHHNRRVEGSERLQALLQSLDAIASGSSASSPPTAAQLNKLRHSVPLLQLLGRDIKCPVCHKVVPSDDVEMHLVMCLTRPQLSYNDDVLTSNKGECAICLEDMDTGNTIARLPCLCIYHKECIDQWFERKNTCPEHPGDE